MHGIVILRISICVTQPAHHQGNLTQSRRPTPLCTFCFQILFCQATPRLRSCVLCRSMGVAAASELVAALAFSGDRWRAQLLAKGFLQVHCTGNQCSARRLATSEPVTV